MSKPSPAPKTVEEVQNEISRLKTDVLRKSQQAQALMEKYPGGVSMEKMLSAQREAAEAKQHLAEAQEELLRLQQIDDPAFVQAKEDLKTLPETYAKKVVELHQLEQAAVDWLNPLHEIFLTLRGIQDEINELAARHEKAHVALGIPREQYLVGDVGMLFRSAFTFTDFLNRFVSVVLNGHMRPQKSIAFYEHR